MYVKELPSGLSGYAIAYPAEGKPYNTSPLSERRDLWDVTEPCTAVHGPTRFVKIPGEPERHIFRDARARVSTKETVGVRVELVFSATSKSEKQV